jgi:type VI secretion system protein ImpM
MTGFYGKLPAKGDFLHRHLPRDFVDAWDDWLQGGMHESREALGEAWLQTYLTSPLWRYVLPAGTCGASAWAGVLMPSMDKVGRYFPMTVATKISAGASPAWVALRNEAWFVGVENILLAALDDEALDAERFDAELLAMPVGDADATAVDSIASPDSGMCLPLEPGPGLSGALLGLTASALQAKLESLSLWWGLGSEQVAPSLAFCRGLPGRGKFTAMLDGNWAVHGWQAGPQSEPALAGMISSDLVL